MPVSETKKSLDSRSNSSSLIETAVPQGLVVGESALPQDIGRYYFKISDTVGVIEKLSSDNPREIRELFFEAVKHINFVVYEIDHKTEDLEHFETWDDLRDLFAFVDGASGRGLQIGAPGFMQYFAWQLSMYDVEHRMIHGRKAHPEAQAYVSRFFDEGVEYVDTGYYYSLACENGLISPAAVRHGHNVSKAFDVVDAAEDYDDDKLSNNYPPFVLYMLHHNSNGCPPSTDRPELSAILERGAGVIRSYREALHDDGVLPRSERDVFEQALNDCDSKLLALSKRRS